MFTLGMKDHESHEYHIIFHDKDFHKVFAELKSICENWISYYGVDVERLNGEYVMNWGMDGKTYFQIGFEHE